METQAAELARRLFWWKQPPEALSDHPRFLAQVMTYGTWSDIVEARAHFGEEAFRDALRDASPGVYDERSWHYWHYALKLWPIPPRPRRKFAPDGI